MQKLTPKEQYYRGMTEDARWRKKRPMRRIARTICAVIVAGIIIGLLTARYYPNPEQRDPEVILNDTLQMNAGDISRDSALDVMKKTVAGREYDSIVKGRAEQ